MKPTLFDERTLNLNARISQVTLVLTQLVSIPLLLLTGSPGLVCNTSSRI